MVSNSGPNARQYHSMAYDSAHDRTILFGGSDTTGYRDDTWIFNLPRFYKSGYYESNVIDLGFTYQVNGNVNWTPTQQPINTSLTITLSFSNTTNEEDFVSITPSNKSFLINIQGRYLKYQALFRSYTKHYLYSPKINQLNISCSLNPYKPFISLLNLENEATVKGTLEINVIASCVNEIAEVCLYINNEKITCDNNAPYEFSWDSTTKENGEYNLTVTAISVLDESSSYSIIIYIDNVVDTNIDWIVVLIIIGTIGFITVIASPLILKKRKARKMKNIKKVAGTIEKTKEPKTKIN